MVKSTPSENLEEQGLSPTSTLLSATSSGKNDTLDESDEHQNHLLQFSPTLLLLTLLAVMITTGLGATMTFWFLAHTHQRGLIEVWKEGAFLLDEGIQLEGKSEAARLTGLTIASASVSACTNYINLS